MSLDENTVVQVLLRERLRLAGSVLPIVRDVHAADDVFQQVVLKALEIREQFREPEHLWAWALRAARHRAIDLARRKRFQCLDEEVLELLVDETPPVLEPTDRAEALANCLSKLSEGARRLLKLRYEDGLRCVTVAEQTEQSADAVYQSYSRIHRQLRLCIERQLAAAAKR